MKIVSVQVGLPRVVSWRGRRVTTGIFKEPVEGAVMLRTLNLDGDGQADLSVHGGLTKAAYAYPSEHYEFWRDEFPEMQLPYGMFGENFTTEGLLETDINIGDRFRIGEAEVVVTEPRMPCYKLGLKFGRTDILKRFLLSGRSGFYFAVLREGEVQAGDAFERLGRDESGLSVADVVRLYAFDQDDLTGLRRAMRAESLPESWRGYFRHLLERHGG
ncbi:MAG TPA: MOSC domain-containing protein [Pyrinomonadaceae bacterium]|nr:MOSC domain-containing protein [Pyrinomonadaceae bacterium]